MGGGKVSDVTDLIDAYLGGMPQGRNLVPTAEVEDLLLDLRNAYLGEEALNNMDMWKESQP
jgi:hypothetical protein